ncbi:MAG: hypothetical protein H0T89_34410 [Deltaproteobacteria bacterium]|nr:hypothetical protein [Deltaproteobacteria bacterium]
MESLAAPLALGALAIAAASPPAAAEDLPPGSIGMVVGAASGVSSDANRLGYGYQVGAQAAWQPMTTERRIGYALKWSFVFGTMYDAGAASVGEELLTLQMDVMAGLRVRPGNNPSRYITLRLGAQMLRANQIILPSMHRAFAGPVASVGFEQYAYGFLFNLDVRVSQIGSGPTIIALMFGASKSGP